ncbi:MAG: pilus assembly protein PilM [Ruminococcus sp.]|jgi:cell division protein FtsA|nr:pilus assembly protein PilM [Ruminococcus sp.]
MAENNVNSSHKSPAQILAEQSRAKSKSKSKSENGEIRNKTSDNHSKKLPVNNKKLVTVENDDNRNIITGAKDVKRNKTADNKRVKKRPLKEQGRDTIFSLDIGTRTVVGILAKVDEDGVFEVLASCSVPHTVRAMMDGQIEDIKQVAKIVSIVKSRLEELSGIKLTKVAIAAAGRALKTVRTSAEFSIENLDILSEDNVKSFEIEAVVKAQNELDIGDASFYCVGHTVVAYELDGYKIKVLAGHRGKRASIDLLAAFLPSGVVESLYAVTDDCGLEVISLTLEPIAAMHVIIPPEVRLINIALVDIGAGTSDIAVSRNGSIVAYAMATIAGDEITEEIIRKYLVSFDVAEEMKLNSGKQLKYRDILGYEHTLESPEFFESIFPAAGYLADTISKAVVEANGSPPAAVFLIGGGSQLPGLTDMVAERLNMPSDRVAVGGRMNYRNISLSKMAKGSISIDGPEFVTPIGIGLAAYTTGGYDFAVITLNGKKKRIFDTKILTVLDLLMISGYKSSQILGKTGRTLNFTLNGEKMSLSGNPGKPSELEVNGVPASINTTLKQGDEVVFTPATDGISASAKIYEVTDGVDIDVITVDDATYPFGKICNVNGKYVMPDYSIKNFDTITMIEVRTLYDLTETLPFDTYALDFYIGGKKLTFDYELRAGDKIVTTSKMLRHTPKPDKIENVKPIIPEKEKKTVDIDESEVEIRKNSGNIAQNSFALDALIEIAKSAINDEIKTDEVPPEVILIPDNIPAENSISEKNATDEFWVTLNGRHIVLEPKSDNSPHEFVELMSYADLDLENPPPSKNMVITLNGGNVSFMDVISIGDDAVVKWADN